MNPSKLSAGRVGAFKAQARAIQQREFEQGRVMKLGHALDEVARLHGFKDWNVASAVAKALDLKDAQHRYAWEDIDSPIERLPFRIIRPSPDRTFEAVKELMRWARQIDLIAQNVPDEAIREMLENIGGRKPYVFVCEPSRFGDDLYRLCDRSYTPIKGLVFTEEQLVSLGVVAWNEAHGTHADFMHSLISDDIVTTTNRTLLKKAARMLAAVARFADAELAKGGESLVVPPPSPVS